jgi:hypothetical protein
MKTQETKVVWVVWSPEFRVVGEYETLAEAQYMAKAFGAGYWVSQA